MAFLDNSGDIILDAVLTETGRKRMTEGNFKISKFACGDDEINYTQYNKNHPSGSAYFDLEIMQTPVFEAITETAAAINYGLLAITRTDLLYLPSIDTNSKLTTQGTMAKSGSVFVIAVNAETAAKIEAETNWPSAATVMNVGVSTPGIIWESGLNTTELDATAANRAANIVNVNSLDTSFTVSVNSLFIGDVMQLTSDSQLSNDSTNSPTVSFNFISIGSSTTANNLDNYNEYTSRGISDLIYKPDSGGSDTDLSAISGPRGSAGGLKVSVVSDLASQSTGTRSDLWSNYGKINQIIFGGSNKYDYIDTTIYVQGDFSSATAQIPVRLMRYAGT